MEDMFFSVVAEGGERGILFGPLKYLRMSQFGSAPRSKLLGSHLNVKNKHSHETKIIVYTERVNNVDLFMEIQEYR